MNTHRSGTTLVELLIYMAIFSIILVSITELFSAVLDLKRESDAISSVEQDGRFILNRMAYDIRRADSIALPASIGTTGTTLRLIIGGQQYTYALNGNNLELTDPNGTVVLNSSETGVSSVSFLRKGNAGVNKKDTIKIMFTLTADMLKRTGTEVKSFSTTIGIR